MNYIPIIHQSNFILIHSPIAAKWDLNKKLISLRKIETQTIYETDNGTSNIKSKLIISILFPWKNRSLRLMNTKCNL